MTHLFSHWLPSSHTSFFPYSHLPSDFFCTLNLPFNFNIPTNPPPLPLQDSSSTYLTSCHFRLLFPAFLLPLLLPHRATVPGRAPPVQAAAGSWGRMLLRELPVRPAQPRLCAHGRGAPPRRWGHCRGLWETALPNGGYVRRLSSRI